MSRKSTKSSKRRLPKPTSSLPSNGVKKKKKKIHRANLHRVPRGIRIAVDLSAHRPSRLPLAYSDLKCFPGAQRERPLHIFGAFVGKTNSVAPSVSVYVPKLEKKKKKSEPKGRFSGVCWCWWTSRVSQHCLESSAVNAGTIHIH